jgi:hypothetical protein
MLHKLFAKFILPLGVMAIVPGVVYAQLYLGVGVGQTSTEVQAVDWNYTDVQEMYAIDFTDKSYKIFGGWRATPSFAVEFGYTDLGKYTEDYNNTVYSESAETKVTTFFTELVGNIGLGGGWKFLGKLGAAYWDAEVKYDNSVPYSDTGSGNGLDPVLGLGFEFSHKFGATTMGVRLEWEQYQNIEEGVKAQISPERTVTYNGMDINTFGLAATLDF